MHACRLPYIRNKCTSCLPSGAKRGLTLSRGQLAKQIRAPDVHFGDALRMPAKSMPRASLGKDTQQRYYALLSHTNTSLHA